jgi:hypothetical protein
MSLSSSDLQVSNPSADFVGSPQLCVIFAKPAKIHILADCEWWQNYKSDCLELYTIPYAIHIPT